MGCVYILSNPAMPGLLKIGFTEATARERAAELSAHSGVPADFVVEYEHPTIAPAALELGVHERLGTMRPNARREFFRISVPNAIAAIVDCEQSEIFWRRALFTVWNRGAQDWRDRALEAMDKPVFDRTDAA